jgi:hypothetical protein
VIIPTSDVLLTPVRSVDIRGSSSAVIVLENGSVLKTSARKGNFVRDQGIWLAEHDECVAFPAVEAVFADGYRMERLWNGTLKEDTLGVCRMLLDLLRNDVWHLDYEAKLRYVTFEDDVFEGFTPHRAYIKKLIRDVGGRYSLKKLLLGFSDTINWHRLKKAYTHGDPIIDNLLWRWNNEKVQFAHPVLIDPIPATAALPDLEAVDVGRLIQSAIGYEAVRYELTEDLLPLPYMAREVLHEWLDTFSRTNSLDEARAALHFAIIHMLRGVRTAQVCAPDRVKPLWSLTNELIEEVKKWMR